MKARTMDRAFSPRIYATIISRGDAPGWYDGAPLALAGTLVLAGTLALAVPLALEGPLAQPQPLRLSSALNPQNRPTINARVTSEPATVPTMTDDARVSSPFNSRTIV